MDVFCFNNQPALACGQNGWVAQLAEQRTENPRVGGSIPPPAIFYFVDRRSYGADVIADDGVGVGKTFAIVTVAFFFLGSL